jgi:hypothetical protein
VWGGEWCERFDSLRTLFLLCGSRSSRAPWFGWGSGLWKEIFSSIWFIDSRPATTLGEYEFAGMVFPYIILAYCVQMESLILCIVGPISPCANILDRYVSNPLSLLSSFVTFPSYRNS